VLHEFVKGFGAGTSQGFRGRREGTTAGINKRPLGTMQEGHTKVKDTSSVPGIAPGGTTTRSNSVGKPGTGRARRGLRCMLLSYTAYGVPVNRAAGVGTQDRGANRRAPWELGIGGGNTAGGAVHVKFTGAGPTSVGVGRAPMTASPTPPGLGNFMRTGASRGTVSCKDPKAAHGVPTTPWAGDPAQPKVWPGLVSTHT
jgi:hypothetical protein